MDGTARTLGLRSMGAHWVWEGDAGALHLPQHNAQVAPIHSADFIPAVILDLIRQIANQ